MKISTKGRYAVRVMIDLAVHNTGEYIKVKQIAERQGISEKYLEQIISILNKAGYVKSARGAQGGYRIAGDPADYTVGMVLRLTEGSLCPVACLEDETNQCGRVCFGNDYRSCCTGRIERPGTRRRRVKREAV